MIVALHEAPKDFFKTNPPYSNRKLEELVRKAASMNFGAVEIGPLEDYVSIDGKQLRVVLNSLNIERSVHVGGIFDAKRFAFKDEEYAKARKQINHGIMLCKEIDSSLVSVHPPFFTSQDKATETLMPRARQRFLELVNEEVDFATENNIKLAVESFCYYPFIFKGLQDFCQFISRFTAQKLGVLLDAGHIYQAGIDLSEAVNALNHRLMDVHVHDATLERDYQRATHLPIGKGTINFSTLISCLRKVHYDGWLTLEIRSSEEEIVRSKEFLERLIVKS
jgi:sugar phosphate isomerase/epimerase